MPRHSLFVPSQ